MVATDSGEPRFVIALAGQIGPGQTRVVHPRGVPHRGLYAAHVLRTKLVEAGIEVRDDPRLCPLDDYVARTVDSGHLPIEIVRRESAPVRDLIAQINKPSDNFLADRLLMTVGAVRYGGEPTLAKGVDAMEEWLASAGIDPNAVILDTGSGLSYNSRLSPKQIVRILRAASGYRAIEPSPTAVDQGGLTRGPRGGGIRGSFSVGLDVDRVPVVRGHADDDHEQCFHDSLSVAGVDGTLQRRYRRSELRGHLVGKTGTLTRVIALAGFVSLDDDNEVAFAIVTNGHRHRKRNLVRAEHKRAVGRVLEYLRARTQPLGRPFHDARAHMTH